MQKAALAGNQCTGPGERSLAQSSPVQACQCGHAWLYSIRAGTDVWPPVPRRGCRAFLPHTRGIMLTTMPPALLRLQGVQGLPGVSNAPDNAAS